MAWLTGWGVSLIFGLVMFFVLGLLTGNNKWGYDTKDDERKRYIKQRSIMNSWILLLIFLSSNFVNDILVLNNEQLAAFPIKYPELLYLIVAVLSYFISYVIYSKRIS